MSHPDTINHFTLNMKQGGYDRRHVFDSELVTDKDIVPERGDAIKGFLTAQRQKLGFKSMSLIDAYGMYMRLGSNEAIAKDLKMDSAFFNPLNDRRVDDIYGPGAGNVYATDNPLIMARPLDMYDRQGILTVEKVGRRMAQVASLSVTDLNIIKDHQLHEVSAAVDDLEDDPDIDITLLTGDFNSLDPDMRGASLRSKRGDLLVRTAGTFSWLIPAEYMFRQNHSKIVQGIGYMGLLARTLNHRNVVPTITRIGWQNANVAKEPTAQLAGVSGAPDQTYFRYHDPNKSRPINFGVIPSGDTSDHDAMHVREA